MQALDLGVSVRCALRGGAVDLFDLGADVHEHQAVAVGEHAGAGGEVAGERLGRGLQLAHVPPGERAQEAAERGRRPYPAEQTGKPAVAQHVQIVGAVRAGGHTAHDRHHLRVRGRPGTVLRTDDADLLGHHPVQPAPLRQPHHRHRPGVRDQIRPVERGGKPDGSMSRSHF
nr:hypothetical protein [Streptomyces sp. NRRL B-1347]